jgi:hypothetical protein
MVLAVGLPVNISFSAAVTAPVAPSLLQPVSAQRPVGTQESEDYNNLARLFEDAISVPYFRGTMQAFRARMIESCQDFQGKYPYLDELMEHFYENPIEYSHRWLSSTKLDVTLCDLILRRVAYSEWTTKRTALGQCLKEFERWIESPERIVLPPKDLFTKANEEAGRMLKEKRAEKKALIKQKAAEIKKRRKKEREGHERLLAESTTWQAQLSLDSTPLSSGSSSVIVAPDRLVSVMSLPGGEVFGYLLLI